jgi:hypothetical protein
MISKRNNSKIFICSIPSEDFDGPTMELIDSFQKKVLAHCDKNYYFYITNNLSNRTVKVELIAGE